MTYRIIPREEWGASHDDGAGPAPLPATEVWLHHSVTIAPDLLPPFDDDYAAIRTLERIGENRFGRGISYTFPITPAGLIFEGHSVNRRGAHTAGHNTQGRAICFVGNYETMVPTGAQLDAASWLLVHGWLSGWWDAVTLAGGHRDVKGTACPGRHAYDAMPEIDRRAQELAAALFQAPPPASAPPRPTGGTVTACLTFTTIRQGSKGADTSRIQRIIRDHAGGDITVDGDFGPQTDRRVKDLQRFFGLHDDGIVGKDTWTVALMVATPA